MRPRRREENDESNDDKESKDDLDLRTPVRVFSFPFQDLWLLSLADRFGRRTSRSSNHILIRPCVSSVCPRVRNLAALAQLLWPEAENPIHGDLSYGYGQKRTEDLLREIEEHYQGKKASCWSQ